MECAGKKRMERLAAEVERTLFRISELNDANALRRIHTNIQRHPELDDFDRERLVEAIVLRLRVVSPTLATRIGGAKDAEGREFLQRVHEQASAELDLSGNTLGQGVKTGGYMINGTRYVDVYLSYKTVNGKNLSFSWIQDDIGSERFFELLLRHVGAIGEGELLRETFDDADKAVARYLQELTGLIESPKSSGAE